ncbi:hypothetical protein [Marininema halotolerans]|uniref:Uncharacterized protein n=1 Tax=Marininema halotolerans TaxID=1155944 RepID=A0A1I6U4Y9_9BACL|nr:hypothetical protein [Marininema halotolerans]SFS96492.1 hypothetical protein SAMN05444972_11377 [Marininema halotolerans]
MSAHKKFTFLIIHGMGEQQEFSTLDLFTRNLMNVLHAHTQTPILLEHCHDPLHPVIENFVRLTYSDPTPTQLDLHEYYWAPTSERSISFKEIIQWLIHASKGAKHFYQTHQALAAKYDWDSTLTTLDQLYLKEIGGVTEGVGSLPILRQKLPHWLEPLLRLIMSNSEKLVVDYLGDVATYTTTDKRLSQYATRLEILNGAIAKVRYLLEKDCEHLILLGHSLGSVIAYDVLNGIHLAIQSDPVFKDHHHALKKLITFGSPLDKVAFFLSDQTPVTYSIKRWMINNLLSYRQLHTPPTFPGFVQTTPFLEPILEQLPWENYWDPKDPISGPLDYYTHVENIQVDNGLSWGYAHSGYWTNNHFYNQAIIPLLDSPK